MKFIWNLLKTYKIYLIEIIKMHFNIILCFWAHLDSVLCCGLTFEVPAILGIKYSTSAKKSIFNDWSVRENQFNIVFYNKIYTCTIKKCILLKKITGWIDLQYKIIITKYLNIAIAFHQTRACSHGCSKKWWLQYQGG